LYQIKGLQDAVKLRLFNEVEQMLELIFRFTRKASDKGAAQGDIGAGFAPGTNAFNVALATGGALHALQHIGV